MPTSKTASAAGLLAREWFDGVRGRALSGSRNSATICEEERGSVSQLPKSNANRVYIYIYIYVYIYIYTYIYTNMCVYLYIVCIYIYIYIYIHIERERCNSLGAEGGCSHTRA